MMWLQAYALSHSFFKKLIGFHVWSCCLQSLNLLCVASTIRVYFCMCVCVCAWCIISVWCSTDGKQQQQWRELLPTGIDGKLWNGNKASCHYSSASPPHAHKHTRQNAARQQRLETNEQITSPSSPSLADWTEFVTRDMHGELSFSLLAAETEAEDFCRVAKKRKSFYWNPDLLVFMDWIP